MVKIMIEYILIGVGALGLVGLVLLVIEVQTRMELKRLEERVRAEERRVHLEKIERGREHGSNRKESDER